MVHELADELTRVVDQAAPDLRELEQAAAGVRSAPGAWSVKKILGPHLRHHLDQIGERRAAL